MRQRALLLDHVDGTVNNHSRNRRGLSLRHVAVGGVSILETSLFKLRLAAKLTLGQGTTPGRDQKKE